MNIGDLFLTLLADGSRLRQDIERQGNAAAAAAGATISKTLGGSLSTGLKKSGAAMDSWGQSMSRNVTLPVVGAGLAIEAVGVKFDTTMRQIVALTDVTADEIGGVRAEILKLAPALGRSPQELAEGFYFLASAGFDTKEAMVVLEQTAKAAATGLGTTADVSKVVGSAINAFGKDNLTASDAVDQLIRAIKDGSAEAPDFANSLGTVLGSAGQMGATFADTSAAIAAMTLKAISADEAATSLNQVFTSLLKPTDQAEEAMRGLGLSSEGLRRQLREEGLLSVLTTLSEKFEGNETAAAAVFGNVRALRGIFALTGGEAGKTAAIFEDVARGTTNLGNAFEDTEGPGREMERSLAEIQVSLIELGEDVLPVVVDVMHEGAGIVKTITAAFKSLPEPIRGGVVQMLALAAAMGPVLLVAGKLTKGLGSLLGVFGKIGGKAGEVLGKRMMAGIATEVAAETVADVVGESVGDGVTKASRSSRLLNAAKGLGLAGASAIGAGLAAGIAVLAVAKMVGDQVEAQKADLAEQVSGVMESATTEGLEDARDAIAAQLDSMKILGVIPFELVNERSGPNGLDAQLARLEAELGVRYRALAVSSMVAFREGERVSGGIPGLVDDQITAGVAALEAAAPRMGAAAKAAGAKIPDSIAAGVLAEQNAPLDALHTLRNLMKNMLTPSQDIAKNIGILTSKSLAKGLADERPAVREEARRVQKLAEQELAEAILAGGKVGKKASQALAKGLKDKNPKVRAEARRVKRIVNNALDKIPPAASDAGAQAGRNLMSNFIRTVNSAGAVTIRVRTSDTTIGGRAVGGVIRAGFPYEVNEQTPRSEFIVPSTNGYVLTRSQAESAMRDSAGGGGDTIHVNAPISVQGALPVRTIRDISLEMQKVASHGLVPARKIAPMYPRREVAR